MQNLTPFILALFFILFYTPISAQNIGVYPYLQDVSPTSVYIMWETSDSGTGTVDWGSTPFDLSNAVNSTTITGSGSSRIHTAFISGLNSSTKYYYKVRTASGVTTPLYNFKT